MVESPQIPTKYPLGFLPTNGCEADAPKGRNQTHLLGFRLVVPSIPHQPTSVPVPLPSLNVSGEVVGVTAEVGGIFS